MSTTLSELFNLIQQRQHQPTPNSYTTHLFTAGEDEIVKKIGEEAIELILAAKSQGDQRLIEESADLLYHLLVLLAHRHLTLTDLETELQKRRH
jgi:phosphoribosyl-ATP pyrophosphohydrolase